MCLVGFGGVVRGRVLVWYYLGIVGSKLGRQGPLRSGRGMDSSKGKRTHHPGEGRVEGDLCVWHAWLAFQFMISYHEGIDSEPIDLGKGYEL